MKYSSLKNETVKVLPIPVCNKGVDLTNIPENIEDGYLSDCKNVCFKDGKIIKRNGINAKNIISGDVFEFSQGCNYKLTDTTVTYENEIYKIATAEVDYDYSSYFIYVYLIGEGGSIKNIGYMHFGRTNEDTFYIPYKYLFYVGAPVSGGGIYALMSLHNKENTQESFEKIYEIGADYNSWTQNYNYYIPTVYINGRGNYYTLAKSNNTASTATPTVLEPLNTLTGTFYAYYTSDGYSSTFRLPYANLSNDSVICRIYYGLKEYTEWIVYSGSSYADATLYGITVRVNVDREKGLVNFTSADANYAIPNMSKYRENNIRILAKKEIKNGFKNVVSADNCVAIGSKILLSSGSKIYSASYERPLYFPQSFNSVVGSPDEPITALAVADDKIFAFKENRIYSVKVTDGKNINKIALLADNESLFFSEDVYETECIESENGCSKKNKVTVINGCPVWQSKTGEIFVIYANRVYCVSDKINPYFADFSKAKLNTAVCGGLSGYYILSIGNKAVIMDCNGNSSDKGFNNNAWYILEFPQEIRIIGFDCENNQLLCINDSNICFIASLDGECDKIVMGNHSKNEIKAVDIESYLKTKSFTFGNFSDKKKISKVYLQLHSKHSVSLRIGNEEIFADYEITNTDFLYKNRKIVKLATNLKSLNNAYIKLKTKGDFALGKGEIYIKKL